MPTMLLGGGDAHRNLSVMDNAVGSIRTRRAVRWLVLLSSGCTVQQRSISAVTTEPELRPQPNSTPPTNAGSLPKECRRRATA